MNAIRSVFKVMILSSFILAPLSFMFARSPRNSSFFHSKNSVQVPRRRSLSPVFYWSFDNVGFNVVVYWIERTKILF